MPLKRHWTQRSVPTLALRMAPQHAFLCSKGISKYIVLPDLPHRHKIGGSRSLFLNWQLLGLGKPPPCPLSSSFEDQKLEMNKAVAQQIGDVLKTFGKTLDVSDDFDLVEYGHVLQLVRVMNNMQEQLDPVYFHKACKDLQHRAAVTSLDGQVRRKLKYKVIWLLQVLLLADCLWNSAKLKAVVSKAIELVVPPLFIKVFREALRDSALLVPHKGTLSRWRLLLDGGFMLWCREKNKAGQYLRWMMTDSSTQHGRSFQLTTMLSLKAASAQRALLCAHEQIYLWYLGGTGGTLPQKFHAVLHSLFLEAGSSESDLARYCSEICSCTTDLGTEFALPFVLPMPVRAVFPWIQGSGQSDLLHIEPADDFQILAVAEDRCETVSFSSSLAFPGLLHVIHNAASEVLTVTEILDGEVDRLAKVCSLLSDKQTCDKLLETCFSSPVGQQLRYKLASFSCKVYRPRWGSVAYCCKALMDVKPVLLYGWSLQKYKGASNKVGPDLETANSAITSVFFWASVLVLDKLYELVRLCFAWAEGCPCHFGLDWSEVSKDVRQRWEACPMRGLRVPEICAGDFFAMFESLQNETTISLTVLLSDVSAIERGKLLQEFERGRSFLLHTFTLKLYAFTVPPLVVSAVAHHSKMVAQDTLRKCLECSDPHCKIQRLQSEPLRSQAEAFLEGTELVELPELSIFISHFRFCHAVERRVEGGHARVLRRGRGATQHTEAFDSLALRVSEISDFLDSDPAFLEVLAEFVDGARSPKQLAEKLGFGNHPAWNVQKHPWDKLYRQIVYRADKATLYHVPPPCIALLGHEKQPAKGQNLEQGAIADRDVGAHYLAVLRDSALCFFHDQMKDLESASDFRIYSCTAPPPAATMSLLDRLKQQTPSEQCRLPLPLPSWVGDDCKFWFSIVDTAPYRSKRARAGYLTHTDLAISVHQCLHCDENTAYVLSTPVNLDSTHSGSVPVEQLPLVLTTHMFGLEALQKSVCWEVSPEAYYAVELGNGPAAFDRVASGLLELLLTAKSYQVDEKDPLVHLSHLHTWKELGYVEACANSVGATVWSMSDLGRASVKSCWKLLKRRPLLTVRDGPLEDLSRYELLCHLERLGWRMQTASSGRHLVPFTAGDSQPLVWYMKRGKDANAIPLSYLRLLLTAEDHRLQIPHLAQASKYKQLLNKDSDQVPAIAPAKRKQCLQIEGDDWGLLVCQPEPKKQRKRATREDASVERVLALLDEPDDFPGNEEDCCSDEVSGSELDIAPAPQTEAFSHATENHAAPQNPTSSTSSSTSSSSSESSSSSSSKEPNVACAKASAKPPKPTLPEARVKAKQVAPHQKTFSADSWGLCLLTPRYKNKVLSGLQMRCTRPEHNVSKRCTKELSFGVAGDQQTCRRMLKAWIVFGASVDTRDLHMFQCWKLIQQMKSENGRPQEDALDQNIVSDWSDYDAYRDFGSAPRPHLEQEEVGEGLLGPAAEGVPQPVHQQMEQFALQGLIPTTTPVQRSRNKFTGGTTYGVPSWLADARKYGYIHPNLPPPKGCVWRFSNGNTWTLCSKGG
ncbi:Uncharacterized protein (Fragment) [Durusdinium trenchii]|uniref:Uncharacterized protein n=1 Tax=Durusdinium trenchii TaxID=1381693 RepID=A0ABP0KRF4_9DINO